jgi:putative flippase GtrA
MISVSGALIRQTLLRLLRSGAAGILATAANIGALSGLVELARMDPVYANVVAIVLGSIVMFVASKYFVFEARTAKTLLRETVLYAIVQVVGIFLVTWLYKVALGLSPLLARHYVFANLGVNNIVWLFYFFPLWHFVFKTPPKGPIL